MYKCSKLALLALVAISISFNAPVFASSFPGKGDPGAWSDALPYYNLGNKYLSQARYSEASQKFQEAIALYEFDPDFFINLGIALQKQEDYVGAEVAFKSATNLNDKDWTAWNNLGNAYLKQNRLKETLQSYEHALKCNPPAADKAAIQRDLADIHKFLRATGQEPLPKRTGGPPGPPPSAARRGRPPAPPPSAARGGQPPAAARTGGPPGPPPSVTNPTPSKPPKDWGYE